MRQRGAVTSGSKTNAEGDLRELKVRATAQLANNNDRDDTIVTVADLSVSVIATKDVAAKASQRVYLQLVSREINIVFGDVYLHGDKSTCVLGFVITNGGNVDEKSIDVHLHVYNSESSTFANDQMDI